MKRENQKRKVPRAREIELGQVLTCVYCGRHGTRAFVSVPVKGEELRPACTAVTACGQRRRRPMRAQVAA